MCNRIRGLKEWSEIPRSLTRPLINFEYNPNVAPTEQVPAFLAERGKPLATRMARFGINLASRGGKRHPLGPERFAVCAVNPAVNKVSEKNIDAIERAA
jgi:hypothetical protein